MVSVAQTIAWFHDWLGYRDNAGTKIWMLGEAPHWPGSAFCGKTQEVCCNQLKLTLAPTTDARIVYVPNVVVDAKNANKWITSYQSHTGDWVIFDWLLSGKRDHLADHIGMILRNDPSLPYVDTIEGNTNDSNNNGPRGIFIRRRYRIDIMGCVDRQHAYTDAPTPVPPVAAVPSDQDLNKWLDESHRKALQSALGVAVDGIVGRETITALQKSLGSTADGVISAPSSRLVVLLQKKAGLSGSDIDGILGPKTAKAVERLIDEGKLLAPVVAPTPRPTPAPLPKPAPKPAPKPNRVAPLKVDGVAGKATVLALQKYLGTTSDGIISGQDAGWHKCLPANTWLTVKWQSPGKADGSRAVVKLQGKLKLKPTDGIIGVSTAKAIQRWVGSPADGILGPNSVKALQKKLNSL